MPKYLALLALPFCLAAALSCTAADRDALRKIVQEQCLIHWQSEHTPAPCVHVDAGSAVLLDRKGGAHFLLIATRTLSGIESPEATEPGAPNYFAQAWAAREQLDGVVGHGVRRDAVGLATNPISARSQDQLHIHIECVRPELQQALREAAPRITGHWSPLTLAGVTYQTMRLKGNDLEANNPIRLAAQTVATPAALANSSLVVVGMQYADGPGFALLTGVGLPGELLLDSSCAAA